MSLREVTTDNLTPVTPAEQPSPMLQWVKIADLRIDDRYQRPLNKGNLQAIQRIAANFLWSRFTPVLVAPIPGGLYAVIDGQHRSHAAALCGFEQVPAMIVPVAPQEQALAFAEVNSRAIRVSQHHIFKAALAAGETWAERADLAVAKAGCRLMSFNASTATKKPGEVYCIGFVRQMIERGHGAALTACLDAIRRYDTTGRVTLYTDGLLRPFVTAVGSNPDFLRLDLVGFLQANDPWKIIGKVDRLREEGKIAGNTVTEAYRLAFVTAMRGYAERVAA